MPVAIDLDRSALFNDLDQILGMGNSVKDVEEGEISSSSASVEMINKQKGLNEDSKGLSNEPNKVWTLQELYKYGMSYTPGLYSLAWAQAVQNKPFDEVLNSKDSNNKPNDEESSNSKNLLEVNARDDSVNEAVKDKVVIDLSIGDDDDDEREEGELEEGEIDLTMSDSDVKRSEYDLKGNDKELEERIGVIREAFESVIKSDSIESLDLVCLRIEESLDSLSKVILEDLDSKFDELVKLAFEAINTLNKSMLGSVIQNQQEQHKQSFSRLLHRVTSQKPSLFAPEQMKEIEFMITSLDSPDTDKQIKIENNKEEKTSIDFTKLETSSIRGRGMLLPLLDLHKNHDEDSLPSPTRDGPSSIMPPGIAKPEWPSPVTTRAPENVAIPYYETDPLKAVSTYQQKFYQNPVHMSDLPSPTPSDNCETGIGDTGGEVSKIVNSQSLPQLSVSSSCAMDICSSQAANTTKSTIPVKFSGKSRDPRLRFANKDTVSSRVSNVDTVSKKHKLASDPSSSRPTIKKQKNGSIDITTSVNSSSNASNMVDLLSNGLEHLQGACNSNTIPLDSILKDIATNPEVWINLIKKEQQIAADPIKNTTHLLKAIPPVNVTLPKSSVVAQKSAGILQTSPQTASMDKLEKIHMKPRDPRRALLQNTVQKVGNSSPNTIKTSAPNSISQELRVGLNSCNQPIRKVSSLKNTAAPNIVSVSRTPAMPPINPQAPSSQPYQDVPKPINNQRDAISSSEEVSEGPSRSPNDWGDVEHLFEGLDEKQKEAFHKERARRINEQKKMFAACKLCLVLDLDHTLLNSAKFVEVDPVHEEILRKKEEQDREKSYRHLFRFPHMGMWTKLRPGIWNFLEKASKLFELHLYTMGNKLYATEMAKLLDPKGTLFAGRVISRGDDDEDGDISKSKDLEGVLGMESGVVIIDDSIRVWPHNKLNLIVVERYIYFPCSRRQFGLLGPSLLEIDHDERPEAGTLASSLAVIERIHQNFFAHKSLDEADVRNILAMEQRKILGGCRIVFSRVFPVGEANPHLHPLWQTAEQFGATCTNRIDDQVTHVVAHSLGTDKVNWALSTGRFVVHPGWVEASALLYRRANEQDFAIKT